MTRSILLVEDNPGDETLMLRALKKSGITNEVIVARDGAEALDYLFHDSAFANVALTDFPTVVMLDLNLPKIGGLEVLRRIRDNPVTRLIPVVILTSSDEEEDRLKGYQIGANSYVRKPVEFNQFASAVQQLGLYWLILNEPAPPRLDFQKGMNTDIEILILEDSVKDAELLERELRRGAIAFTARKVDTKEDFVDELTTREPDLIIADYRLPAFDGLEALEIVRAHSAVLPFILVSGYIGEERAIEALKHGATDFILKDRLGRLVSCVQRALGEAEERAEHHRLAKRFALFVESAPNAMVMVNAAQRIEMVNGQTERMFGFARVDLLGQSLELLFPDRFREPRPGLPLSRFVTRSRGAAAAPSDVFGLRRDGTEFPVEVQLNPIDTADGTENSLRDRRYHRAAPDRTGEGPAAAGTGTVQRRPGGFRLRRLT